HWHVVRCAAHAIFGHRAGANDSEYQLARYGQNGCVMALGRKNWIHVGSENAGPKVAAILSVLESCRRLQLPVREYLASVLPGLAKLLVQRVGQYTPATWAASRV